MNINETAYDVVVAGGGMVGALAALMLAQAGFSVLVLDRAPPARPPSEGAPDLRVSAISCASAALLRQAGAWARIDAHFRAPYRRLETWEWQEARVSFDAADLGLPELGFMVENDRLQGALWQAFADQQCVTVRAPAALAKMDYDGGWRLTLTDGDTVRARLLIGADGARSTVREWAGIGSHGWQYRQSCMLISVSCALGQQDVTWQEFTPNGPRAFLPLYDNWASLVWYDRPARIRQLQSLSPTELAGEIRAVFPARLGEVNVHATGAFALTRSHATSYVRPGLALVGDAAHTINPLAGQGVNLGFRDVQALAAVITEARDGGLAWDSLPVLKRYQQRRYGDNVLMQTGMDIFYSAFSNSLPPMKLARNIGLMVAQRAGPLKARALRYALGL